MKLDRWSFLLITVCFLIISIEFIPSTKSSIFWFNGCAHYMLPFTMCQVTAAWLLKYSETYRVRTLTGITFLMTLLGGANYQAALFALITACYVGIAGWLLTRNKRVLLLLIPVFTELAGLIVSMKAPGNKVRGGEEFGFSVRKGIETIADSFLSGIKDIGTYFQERPLIFVGLLMLFLLFILIFSRTDSTFHFQHSGWLAGMLFCLYSAMQAPAIYAGVEVSRGVLNTNFQVFLLAAAGILLIIAEKLTVKLRIKWKEHTEECVQRRIVVPGILLCLLLTVIFRSNIKTSTFYVCLDYIVSGQAADYKEQMDLQTRLLEDEQVEDVVLPFINDIQGPLMHMPVTVDPEAWTNTVVKEFYGKNSVVAMERPKWIELYGE